MLPTWTPTVFWLMKSRSPISRFVRPSEMRARTSCSRRDRPNVSVRGAGASPTTPRTRADGSPAATAGPTAGRPPRREAVLAEELVDALGQADHRPAGQLAQLAQHRPRRQLERDRRGLLERRPGPGPRRCGPRRCRACASASPPARPGDLVRVARAARQQSASGGPVRPGRRGPRAGRGGRPPWRGRHRPRGASRSRSTRRTPGRPPPPRRRPGRIATGRSPRPARSRRRARVGAGGGVDLGDRRRHLGDEAPVLGAVDELPAALGGPPGVGVVVAPQGERGRRPIDRHAVLRVADGLELEQELAEQPAGVLAGARLDLDDRQAVDRVDERDAGRAPLEGRRAQRPRLRPATEQEQRVRGVAPQEVAVDGLEAGPTGRLDPLVGDLHRLLAPADEVEDGRQVGVDAEQLVVVAGLLGQRPRLARAARRRTPGRRPSRATRRASSSRGPAGLDRPAPHASATRIASRASRSASENVPSSILTWASAARTVARSTVGSAGTRATARSSAATAPSLSPAARRYRPSRSWSSPSAVRSRRSSSALITVSMYAAARAGRPAAKAASAARIRSGAGSDRRRRRRRRSPAGAAPAARAVRTDRRQRELERGRASPGRVDGLGPAGRRDRPPRGPRRSRGPRASARPRRVGMGRRGRRRGPGGGGGAGPAGGPPTTARPTSSWRKSTPVSPTSMMPCSTPSASPAVRSASIGPSPRRGRLDERGGSRRSAVSSYAAATSASSDGRQRPAGRCEQAEHPPALGRSEREAGDDEVLEPAGQRRAGQLASGRDQLLGDERDAAAPLGEEDERRAGRPFALDPLDEVRQLAAPERLDPESLRRPPGVGHRDDVGRQRMGARQLVRLVGRDEADPVRAAGPGRGTWRTPACRRRRGGGPRGRA